MRQRDWSTRPNKRRTGGVHVSPGPYRHELPHEIETCLDNMVHTARRSAMQIIGPRGLGKAATTIPVLHHFGYLNLYVLEKSGHRVVWVRPMFHVVVDAFSRLILEATCVTEKTAINRKGENHVQETPV